MFAAAVRALAGEADIEVRGGRTGFPEALYPRIARHPGVRRSRARCSSSTPASPDASARCASSASTSCARRSLQPALAVEERFELLAPDTVLLSARRRRRAGSRQRRPAAPHRRPTHGGVARRRRAARVGAARPGGADRYRQRAVALRPAGRAESARRAPGARRRPRRARATHPGAAAAGCLRGAGRDAGAGERLSVARLPRESRMCSRMVALFTGGFLVFSAQALETARRRGEHALLRVLGLDAARDCASRARWKPRARRRRRALLGLALGYALALFAVRALGAATSAPASSAASRRMLALRRVAALVYFAAGIAIAVLRRLAAGARRRAHAAGRGRSRRATSRRCSTAQRSAWPGLALIVAGVALALLRRSTACRFSATPPSRCLLLGAHRAHAARRHAWCSRLLPLPRSPAARAGTRAAAGRARARPR